MSDPKGHWEDGGKVWVEDHDCSLPVSNADLIARASEIAREGLFCLSCGHVGAATGECCDHPNYDGASREQVADAITALLVPALAGADARMAELEAQGWELSGSITDLGQRLETAETLLEEARRALAPFIRLADNVFSDGKNATVADEVTLWCFNDTDITFGDLRRARAALDRIGK